MQSVYPVLKYEDAHAAVEFLERAFGFERHAVHEGETDIAHAELRLGDEFVMLGSTSEGDPVFNHGAGRCSVYVAVDDPDAHHARAREAGAKIELELRDEDYGSRGYTARDPEGNLWNFGTYRPG
jgi:uncharacterized glyoxalase superfamily protein PhnB